jgi:MFS family permease
MLHFLPEKFRTANSPLITYILMIFFIAVGDATMSYMAPVVMQHMLGATQMGFILATSSAVGTIVDFTFAKMFGHKKSVFFKKILLSLILLFPLSFLIYRAIPSFLFGMIVWGVYFEAMVFANYHTIHENTHPKDHIWAWGMLTTIKNIGWVIGPLFASYLDFTNERYPFFMAIGSFLIAIFLFFFQKNKTIYKPLSKQERKTRRRSFWQELKIWRIYLEVIWPLLFMLFMFELIDSTFFSIGPVFAENLHQTHPLGSLFITMYTVPSLLFGILAGFMAKPLGKKRAAFIAGLVTGGGLMLLSQVQTVELILATTFFSSMGVAILFPEIAAIFEDFVARSHHSGNDIVGLTAVIASISYVIGPIANGYLADHIGTQHVFGLWGAITFVFSLIALFVVKRKIHMPQSKVSQLIKMKR